MAVDLLYHEEFDFNATLSSAGILRATTPLGDVVLYQHYSNAAAIAAGGVLSAPSASAFAGFRMGPVLNAEAVALVPPYEFEIDVRWIKSTALFTNFLAFLVLEDGTELSVTVVATGSAGAWNTYKLGVESYHGPNGATTYNETTLTGGNEAPATLKFGVTGTTLFAQVGSDSVSTTYATSETLTDFSLRIYTTGDIQWVDNFKIYAEFEAPPEPPMAGPIPFPPGFEPVVGTNYAIDNGVVTDITDDGEMASRLLYGRTHTDLRVSWFGLTRAKHVQLRGFLEQNKNSLLLLELDDDQYEVRMTGAPKVSYAGGASLVNFSAEFRGVLVE